MPDQMPDVVVLLPGITGSELKKDGRVIWGWSGRALAKNILTMGADYVATLRLRQDSPVDEFLDDKIVASRVLPDLHVLPGVWKIDGYGAVADFITSEFLVVEGENFFPFPYDWRRDNRSSAHTLKKRTDDWLHRWRAKSGNRSAKLILIAHSMGGLVSRYFLEVLEGWRDTRALITFGTPFRGSLNAVDALANGMKELGIIDLSPLARELTSLYQLLPTYECIDAGGGHLRRVVDGGLPNADLARIKDAFHFHEEIRCAVDAHQQDEAYRRDRYHVYPIVGYRQPTNQSGRILGDRVELSHDIRGTDLAGDGTVPRPSGMPLEQQDGAMGMFAATKHASLQNADAVLAHLGGVLSGLYLSLGDFRAVTPRLVQLSLDLADLYRADEPIIVRARPSQSGVDLGATFVDVESGREVDRLPMTPIGDGWHSLEFAPPQPGAYRVSVSGNQTGVEPAADVFEVIAPA
jgi:hypothetical protein